MQKTLCAEMYGVGKTGKAEHFGMENKMNTLIIADYYLRVLYYCVTCVNVIDV